MSTPSSLVARPLASSGTHFGNVEVNHDIDLDHRLKREGEAAFGLPEIVSTLAYLMLD